MEKEIEQKVNDESNGREIRLNGKIKIDVNSSGAFTVGHLCVKGIINIKRSDIVIDGSAAEIEIDLKDCTTSDWSLFFISPSARNVVLKGLKVRVHISNPCNCNRMFSLVYNTAFGLKIDDCHFEVYSDKQLNISGIYNNGNLDTHMETRADNLSVENSFLRIECFAEIFEKECSVYGLYNYLANSISMQNTFVYAVNKGNGSKQKAVGVYTNGRFGRFVGNNIKANATHNIGLEKEHAYAFGFINEGLYTIITSNNIVGEWSGMSIGLENKGDYTIVSGNKILATHTICGRSVRNYANNVNIEGNVFTSTSRNARLIEHDGSNCIISRNIMEVLMDRSECRSGCGIYAVGHDSINNIISENIIKNIVDCGIFANETVGEISRNRVVSYEETVTQAGEKNTYITDKLDEKNIRSIYRN